MGDVATCRGILVPITTLEELNHRARQADQLEQVYNTCEDVRESEGEGKGVAAGFLTGAAVALLALLLL